MCRSMLVNCNKQMSKKQKHMEVNFSKSDKSPVIDVTSEVKPGTPARDISCQSSPCRPSKI